MSCRIRPVERRVSAGGLAGAHPGMKNRILLSYTRIENAHKVRKKISIFLLFIDIQQTFSFPFFLLRHNKCLNASMLTTAVFELVQQFYHAAEIGRPNASNAAEVYRIRISVLESGRIQHILNKPDRIRTTVLFKFQDQDFQISFLNLTPTQS